MDGTFKQPRQIRSNRLLFKKFLQFLLPTMITYAAVSLNEFADSMLVSRLLGSEAMAIVGLGMPLMLAMAAVYSLLGSGGATVYAICLGRRDHETAGKSLSAALLVSLIVGLLFLSLGFLFFSPLSKLLCGDSALLPQFETYLRVLLLSAPFIIVILTFASFLPSAGYPGFSTAVNVTANVVNIIMDYVYIHVFHMGVEGAAWATLTGYLCAMVLVIAAVASKKIKLYVSRQIASFFGTLKETIRQGGPDAMTQIGLAMQFAVCNSLAMACAGADGVVSFSLCTQTNSVLSVFQGALIGSSVPMLAVLHGQRDYRGEASILNTAMLGQLIVSLVGTAAFVIFAPQLTALYNITEAGQAALAVHALRIYTFFFIPRFTVVIYFRYLKVIGLSTYATWASALDSFGLIIPVAWLMTRCFGIEGLWYAFPLASTLLLLFMVVWNRRCEAKSNGKLHGLLLYEQDEECEPVMDVTITQNGADIVGISRELERICLENGMTRQNAVHAALAVEEMCVYAANNKRQDAHMDVLVRLYKGDVEIEFRSLGAAFNPLADADGDITENIRLLRGIAAGMDNEYILGMNSTRIVLAGSALKS